MSSITPAPFNPLDKKNLAESIAAAIERCPVVPLAALPAFGAAGLYFLYYAGPFDLYSPIVNFNTTAGRFHWPIYIGKGMPPGVRKGSSDNTQKKSWGIHDRLQNHEKSIKQVSNLKLDDFSCRWLSMDEAFIHLGETLLISKFRPVWNVAVEGFGNKAVGSGRDKAMRSNWDALHPGRGGAAVGASRKTVDQIRGDVDRHLEGNPPRLWD
jgi:hypothetical protein